MKWITISVVAVAVLLGAVTLHSLLRTPFPEPPTRATSTLPNTPSTTTTEVAVPEPGTSTIAALQMTARDLECTFTAPADGLDTEDAEGTMFIHGDELRVDTLQRDPDLGTYVTSLIMTDDRVYLWSDFGTSTNGVEASRADVSAEAIEAELNAPVGPTTAVAHECRAWRTLDPTVFDPPGDVLFQDWAAVQAGGMEYGTLYGTSTTPAGSPQ